MQAGEIFSMSIYVVMLIFSVSAVILFMRTRSKASAVMCAGVAIFLLGFALAFWGPKTTTAIERPSEGDVYFDAQVTTSKYNFGYMIIAGELIFVFGFLFYAIGARPIVKPE